MPPDFQKFSSTGSCNISQWRTEGGFANIGSVLDGGEDLSDPETWNQFPLRSIVATFSGPGDGLIRATISLGEAVIVPEPSTATCAIQILFMGALFSLVSRQRLLRGEPGDRHLLHVGTAKMVPTPWQIVCK